MRQEPYVMPDREVGRDEAERAAEELARSAPARNVGDVERDLAEGLGLLRSLYETIVPSSSAAVSRIVPPACGVPWSKFCARLGSMSLARDSR